MSTFVYPWDLARLGVDRTLEQIAADGFDAIYLAATYHPIDAVSPKGGLLRLYSSARGAVHFTARPERYGRIQPLTSSPEVCAVWSEVATRCRSMGIDLVPWTVVLYQPWIVDQHPDCARVLPSGDRIDAGVCPSNDDVRGYLTMLCGDLVDQFGVGTLHLEGTAPASFDYGWLRPRMLVDVSRLARLLLALCFCRSCRARGADAGLDVGRLQRLVNDAVAEELALGSTGSAPADLLADVELRAFVDLYVRASVELIDAVSTAVDGSGVGLSGVPWTPFAALGGSRDEELVREMLRPLDRAFVRPRSSDDRTRAAMAVAADRDLDLSVLLVPAQLGSVGGAGPGRASPADRTAEDLRGVAEIGAAEVAVYNYGLLRDVDVRRLAADIRRLDQESS